MQNCKNLNNVPSLCTKLFQKMGLYSRGDIIQGRHYLRIYSSYLVKSTSSLGGKYHGLWTMKPFFIEIPNFLGFGLTVWMYSLLTILPFNSDQVIQQHGFDEFCFDGFLLRQIKRLEQASRPPGLSSVLAGNWDFSP